MENDSVPRDSIFISKATPGDDAFVLWLAPRLEAAGYRVFADILGLDAGDEWRGKLTSALQERAARMLLCCSDETLQRRGVREEISIAEDLVKQLQDPNFIIPLRLKPFKKVFGIGGLQYVDFCPGWAPGLTSLLKSLDRQGIVKAGGGVIQPAWLDYQRRLAIAVERSPETLTSNWLRIMSMPDEISYLTPTSPADDALLGRLGRSFSLPLARFGQGFLGFVSSLEMEEHFLPVGRFRIEARVGLEDFMSDGAAALGIRSREAHSLLNNLLRQAWEKHCIREGFFAREFSGATAFHVDATKLGLGKRVSWGRQGERRNSMLRNKAKNRVWEYGVSATPSLFPYPHLKLKGRVLFSDLTGPDKTVVIADKRAQFRLRRSICSGWRNKAWHGRLMAFMELLAGESPYVDLAVGSGDRITLDAMPVQFTAPVTARQTHQLGEDAEETDRSTLTGFQEEEADA